MGIRLVIPFLLLFCAAGASAGQASDRWTPGLMTRVKRVGGTAVSPDGRMIAFTVSEPFIQGERSEYLSQVWIVSRDGKDCRRLTSGDRTCTVPAFSPDGGYLAFLSPRGDGKLNQVWILPLGGGEAERITDSGGGVVACAWSPDGNRIAYTAADPESPAEEQSRKTHRDMTVVDAAPKFTRLYTTTVARDSPGGRAVKLLTPGAMHIVNSLSADPPFDWSPDGKTIVFSHQPEPSADAWLRADISAVPADGGAVSTLVDREGADLAPRFSPDGSRIAFLSEGGRANWKRWLEITVIPARGGQAKHIALNPECFPLQMIGWSFDGASVYVLGADHTSRRVFAAPADGGGLRTVTPGPGENTDPSLGKDGKTLAFVHQGTEIPPDVHVVDPASGSPAKITDVHAGFSAPLMGKTDVIRWKSKDGLEIEGLLTYPVSYVKGRRYPLVLNVHGGPMSFFTEAYTGAGSYYPVQAFAQEGYAYLQPNPRGSAGYGREFLFANQADWGFGDYDDLMAGVDAVIERGIAHPDSLCVMGGSYGGFMTAFIITKTNRFKAASDWAGVTNLMSFTGTTDIPSFIPDYFDGDFWDRLELYRKHSPMFNIKSAVTPLQILHGAEDKRVPLSQSTELYSAMKRLNRTVEMIIYPRTPHSPMGDPVFLEDIGGREIAWFNKCLGR